MALQETCPTCGGAGYIAEPYVDEEANGQKQDQVADLYFDEYRDLGKQAPQGAMSVVADPKADKMDLGFGMESTSDALNLAQTMNDTPYSPDGPDGQSVFEVDDPARIAAHKQRKAMIEALKGGGGY